MQNPGCKAVRLFGIWLRGKIHELAEVERGLSWVVKDLFDAEINGRNDSIHTHSSATSQMPAKYKAMEQSIAERYWNKLALD